jgi:N-formylglutamate deformylase
MDPFKIQDATSEAVPIIISVPHCGTRFPEELSNEFKPELIRFPDDTDWFVEKLYEFAPAMGIKIVHAVYSRWVIDLNRDPESKPLYTDGRLITGLCPVTDFTGTHLYKDERQEVRPSEVARRIEAYYHPYHLQLEEALTAAIKLHGKVLLWDCHSIRQHVPAIHEEKFPDLILGNNDGLAAGEFITEIASKSLAGRGYSFENNFLFKGGYITRKYGQPKIHQHALQLEMTKVNYMDDSQTRYDKVRAAKMQETLTRMFEKLITVLLV